MKHLSSTEKIGSVTVVQLPDSLSKNDSAVALGQMLKRAFALGYANLLLDCSQVEHMDSFGMSILLNSLQRAREYGGSITLFAPTECVQTILELTNTSKIFPVFKDKETALKALQTQVEVKKILVIDDNRKILVNIMKMLKAEGFEVVIAEDGQTGLALAQQHIPDLITCDIMMPNLNGYEVLTALRHNPETATIPFIFLTAKSTDDDIRKGLELGSNDYITKPFTRDEILGAIRTQLEKREELMNYFKEKFSK